MLGEDILVAPVLEKKSFKTKVYLPAGEWEHLFFKTKHQGGQWHEVQVPYGQPAAFIKVGSKWAKGLREGL
jgi:alpha-glucosidase